MYISKNHVVAIHYTLTGDDGQTLDSSSGGDPLAFIFGAGHIIPGLEDELEGKTTGDKLNVSIPPDKAYGPRREEMIQAVPKAEFQDSEQLNVGDQFEMETEQGPIILTVVDLQSEHIVLDGNHPLAGETLHFEVDVVTVREATEEELAHGHVHGPGGHTH